MIIGDDGFSSAEQEAMTLKQFLFVINNMHRALTPPIAEAARRCLVEPGESQKVVSEDTGISPSQISEAIRKIIVRRDELLAEKSLLRRESWLPAELDAAVALMDNHILDPLIAASTKKKRRPTKKT